MSTTKRCTTCGEEKPLEAFFKRSSVSTKRIAECKTCMAERFFQWRQAHPEKVREYARRWAQAHADTVRAKAAARRDTHREYMRDYMREYRREKRQEDTMTLNEAQVQVLTEMTGETRWRTRLEPDIAAAVRALVRKSFIVRTGAWDYTITDAGRTALTRHQQAQSDSASRTPEQRYYECRRCHDVLVHTRGGRLPRHCPDCRTALAADVEPMRENECMDCHTLFPACRTNHQRCPACSRKRALDLMAVARARRAGSTLPAEQLIALSQVKREVAEAVSNARRQAYERYEQLRQRLEQS